jgi:hypothetical protein
LKSGLFKPMICGHFISLLTPCGEVEDPYCLLHYGSALDGETFRPEHSEDQPLGRGDRA